VNRQLTEKMKLRLIHCELAEANAFVEIHHRHLDPVVQHRFSLAAVDEFDGCHGVAICGRPRARMLDGYTILEVYRVATFGTYNATSFLYGAARRTAKALGFARIITYTLPHESGASLKAAGWVDGGLTDGGEWARDGRQRELAFCADPKRRWFSDLIPKAKAAEEERAA
jgi:hypothetical protein